MLQHTEVRVVDDLTLRLVATEFGLSAVELPPFRHAAADSQFNPSSGILLEAAGQLQQYFSRKLREFDLPLDLQGTEFQKRVWNELKEIPYGKTRSYSQIAEAIGAANAVRAVGAANGSNPLAIVIPCHRVIGANGKLTGYGGGLPLKKRLLELEGAWTMTLSL